MNQFDVIIVGGGPAGMSAALILGRCMRKVLVCDTCQPRNAGVKQAYGFLTRDGIPPSELLALGRQEIRLYPTVTWQETEIVKAECQEEGFKLTNAEGSDFFCKKLLLATGVKDILPEITGVDQFYPISVHHCPYCHGYEVRHKPLVAFGIGKKAFGLSLSLKTWSSNVTLCTDGVAELTDEDRDILRRNEVVVQDKKVKKLVGVKDQLEKIVFEDGTSIPCEALFFTTGNRQHSNLAEQLNCDFTDRGAIRSDHRQETQLPGLFVAGDADVDMQQLIVAASEGAKAGIAINMALQADSRK